MPVYAADAGDHEALLADFLDAHRDWDKYRTWSDDTPVAAHESLTRRAQFTHEAAPKDTAWAFAAYDSPVGERLWHATATARTPAALVRTLLDTLASPDTSRPEHGTKHPDHTLATGPDPALSQAASTLVKAGWQQTSYTWGIQWAPPNGDGAGLRFDARTTRSADSLPGWTAWAGTSIDRPTWRFRLSPHTPASALEDLAHELAHRHVALRLPSAGSPRQARHAAPSPALPPQPHHPHLPDALSLSARPGPPRARGYPADGPLPVPNNGTSGEARSDRKRSTRTGCRHRPASTAVSPLTSATSSGATSVTCSVSCEPQPAEKTRDRQGWSAAAGDTCAVTLRLSSSVNGALRPTKRIR
nr:DUF317 domain-containing protein [Streptomyces sp. WAC 06783]